MPSVEIQDSARFAWRGLLLDVARHYIPPEDIKKFVDIMAFHKFNWLQLHLTDDQGWRIEIKKYPRLTQVGSVRKESPMRGHRDQGDGTPYGPFFYTQAEMRDLVAFAQARHIIILPEVEMPGHFLAALTAYPEYSCKGGPFAVRTRWGVEPDILCVGNDRSCQFVQDILEEIVAIFPSPYVHIGGDESPRDRWRTCPRCQARMKAEGLKSEAQLQTWLNHRVESFLATKARRLIGWDEILEGGLTPGATVMSWRGTEGGLAAAKAGHDVVMSPTSHCYLDYAQAKGPDEPECIGGFLPLETVYAFEPVPANLPEPRRPHILGGQGNVWTEYIRTLKEVEYFTWPRAAALSEVLWSPVPQRNFPDFQSRLRQHQRRLEVMGVNYRPME
jgi:hexosaminidase